MLRVERTFDQSVVDSIFHHKDIERFVCDDFTLDAAYKMIDCIYYLAAFDEDEVVGMFMVHPLSEIIMDSHVAIMPWVAKEKNRAMGKSAINWVFDNTSCLKLNASVPVYNELVLDYAKDIGFLQEGINKQSIMRYGKLHDQIYLGIERLKWGQQ